MKLRFKVRTQVGNEASISTTKIEVALEGLTVEDQKKIRARTRGANVYQLVKAADGEVRRSAIFLVATGPHLEDLLKAINENEAELNPRHVLHAEALPLIKKIRGVTSPNC